MLVLLVHLGLGYYIYQQVANPGTSAHGTELKAIDKQETPAIP